MGGHGQGGVTILGAAGFLGQRLTRTLAARGVPLVLADRIAPPSPPAGAELVLGELQGTLLQDAIRDDTVAVVNLASVLSGGAEEDFDLGYEVNLLGLKATLERCRELETCPTFVFTSSLAVFGPAARVDDRTATRPQSSYGTQKAIGELLVSDYSRRGFVDGRSLRLPTVCVRPGKPNSAASGFASSILREPLTGLPASCPVPPELELWLASPRSATSAIAHALDLPTGDLGEWRTLNAPGVTASVCELVGALERAGGDPALIAWEPDPAVQEIVGAWPARFETPRALELGFEPADDLDRMVRDHVEEERVRQGSAGE